MRRLSLAALCSVITLWAGCGKRDVKTGSGESEPHSQASAGAIPAGTPPQSRHPPSESKRAPIRFLERAADLGVYFQHTSGITPEKHFPSANGSGAALLDLDANGTLDIYLLAACLLPVRQTNDSPRNHCYRADSGGGFEEVGPAAGLDISGFCQGVSVADINNDGFSDLYVVALGGNLLFLNMGDGTFQNVTEASHADTQRWGASCAFLDFDEDGAIDLYVANYGTWSIETNDYCGDRERGVRLFCRPTYINPEVHSLLRNCGDGTFEEAAERAGIARNDGRGQGVVAADVNGDRHIDLYVANDMCPNFLFLNNGDGSFRDFTKLSGAAYDSNGSALAGMGVDATDLDGDGRPELFVTNFLNEYNNLYHNQGDGFFEDISVSSGLGPDSLPEVKWGTALTDLDNDGSPDVFVVSGHVDDNLHELGRREPYRQRAKVWRQQGKLRFENVSDAAGDYFATSHVSRGAAFGDLDDDGRTDVVVVNLDERPAILMNQSDSGGWIRFQLTGRTANRDAVGAELQVQAGGKKYYRTVKGGGSYLSAHDLRLLVGVGDADEIDSATITWPGGPNMIQKNLPTSQTVRCIEPL